MFLRVSVAAHLLLLLVLFGNAALTRGVLAGYVVYHGFLAWGVLHPRSRLFGPNRSRIRTRRPVVSLTFDDGPHPVTTPQVLDILRERGVRATFFVIGRWAQAYPQLVRRIVDEGHEVGNHSWSHSYAFWAGPPRTLLREVARTERAVESATGRRCRFFRAPVGMKSCLLAPVLAQRGLALVSWDVRFLDGAPVDARRIRRRLRRRVVPGSILLLHDGHDRKPEGNPAVVAALPIVLDTLRELGFDCCGLSGPANEPQA